MPENDDNKQPDLQAEEPKPVPKKKVTPKPEPEPEPELPLEQKGVANLTISNFLRSENLGYLKQGFALWVRNKNIGGKKSRQEWRQLYEEYRTSPVK